MSCGLKFYAYATVSQICSFSPELQIRTPNCLLKTSIWMANGHRKLNMSKMELLVFSPLAPLSAVVPFHLMMIPCPHFWSQHFPCSISHIPHLIHHPVLLALPSNYAWSLLTTFSGSTPVQNPSSKIHLHLEYSIAFLLIFLLLPLPHYCISS